MEVLKGKNETLVTYSPGERAKHEAECSLIDVHEEIVEIVFGLLQKPANESHPMITGPSYASVRPGGSGPHSRYTYSFRQQKNSVFRLTSPLRGGEQAGAKLAQENGVHVAIMKTKPARGQAIYTLMRTSDKPFGPNDQSLLSLLMVAHTRSHKYLYS